MIEELKTTAHEHQLVASEVSQMTFHGQEGITRAGLLLRDVKKDLERYKIRLQEITAPLEESLRSVRDLFRPVLEPLERTEVLLKMRISEAAKEIEEANRRALQQAQAAMQSGDVKTAALAATSVQQIQQAEGVRTQQTIRFRVVDARLIPREFLTLDEKAVKAFIKQHKGTVQPNIPGLVFEYDYTVVAKRS